MKKEDSETISIRSGTSAKYTEPINYTTNGDVSNLNVKISSFKVNKQISTKVDEQTSPKLYKTQVDEQTSPKLGETLMNELTSSDQSQLVLAVESILDKNNDICLDNELQGLQTYFNSPSLNQDIFQVVDNLKQTENNEDILKVDNNQDILKTDNIEYNDVNNEDILKVYDIDKVEDNVKHTNVCKEIDLDQENQTHYKVLNNEDTKNGLKQTEIENKVEENNEIHKQDNIEDKDSQKERILNTLQQINQGYYAVSIVNDNNDEINSQTPTVLYKPVCVNIHAGLG